MRETDYQAFYQKAVEALAEYRRSIEEIEFASPEKTGLAAVNDSLEGLLAGLRTALDSSIELNRILEACPDSVYVVDKNGTTLRANSAFEHTTGSRVRDVIGRNIDELEKCGFFKPSVNRLVLKEKREISIIQTGRNFKETIVTGVPVYDSSGQIYRSVSNAKLVAEIESITRYVAESKAHQGQGRGSDGQGTVVIGRSEAMSRVLAVADSIKDVDSNVLITGETGVGKGVLTRFIHENCSRRARQLVEINCGAIPESLLESELFGYESGAFTGADRRGKPGLIELADGGTVFFDEISELPLLMQVKLLHFIQNKTITKVGGTKAIHVDARVIAATNKNLKKLVDEGAFRADLFYRLNVVPIEIPPLRDRPEDILPAARHFLDKYKKKYGKEFSLDRKSEEALLAYDWPGNLRELENFMERLVVTRQLFRENLDGGRNEAASESKAVRNDGVDQEKCDSADQENDVRDDDAPQMQPARDFSVQIPEGKNLMEILEEVERQVIRKTYETFPSSYKLAEKLGISQASAHRKITKYIR